MRRISLLERRRYFNLKAIAMDSRCQLAQLTEKNNQNKINKTRVIALANSCYMMCLCMDDAVTNSADVKPWLCIYLRIPRYKLPGSHFWKLSWRGKAWQTGAKRFERSTLKRSGWNGLPVKAGNISAAAANCNLLDTRDSSSRARALWRFFFFLAQWSSEHGCPLRYRL